MASNLRLAPLILVATPLLLGRALGASSTVSSLPSQGEAPQFVSVTFDDNFGLAAPGAVGGVRAVVKYFTGKRNPAGRGNAADFDGFPIRTTFFDTSIYAVRPSKTTRTLAKFPRVRCDFDATFFVDQPRKYPPQHFCHQSRLVV